MPQREIKFRIWHKKRKEMFNPTSIDWTISITGEVFNHCGYSIKKDVVIQQYIGMKDEDYNYIFEGDIIEYNDELLYDGHTIGEVFWDEEWHSFRIKYKKQNNILSKFLPEEGNNIKIIGNIFQNINLSK